MNDVPWDQVDFRCLSDFMLTMRMGQWPLEKRGGGGRSDSTMIAVAAAVKEFYEFQRVDRGAGPSDLVLTVSRLRHSHSSFAFLAHVEHLRPRSVNRLAPRRSGAPSAEPKIINFEGDFELMLSAAVTARDRLALTAMYDMGLRIGQVLGLRHGDLDVMRKRVTIVRRKDNANGALSKQKETFHVKASARFLDLYRDYLLRELVPAEIESDYVFVNIKGATIGEPMSPKNLYDQCVAIGLRAGVGHVHPHMLRHTHATSLAALGWTSAEIAKRLGHNHANSCDVYIHLSDEHIDKRLAETEHLIRPLTSWEDD
ncbi:tyrosine-type recombinase/integrase [Demequina sp.]|uniref:tyrosine-type recombinase/integrase n=1 Tax=Demequina sp. TaxID=2050685 RepID=UPI003D0F5529